MRLVGGAWVCAWGLLRDAGWGAAVAVRSWEAVQELWSGYGMIWRCGLSGVQGAKPASVIVKAIDVHAPAAAHPRGWQGDRSHQRKLRSYAVECCFYRDYIGPSIGRWVMRWGRAWSWRRLPRAAVYCRVLPR